jgi:hypothetical protein
MASSSFRKSFRLGTAALENPFSSCCRGFLNSLNRRYRGRDYVLASLSKTEQVLKGFHRNTKDKLNYLKDKAGKIEYKNHRRSHKVKIERNFQQQITTSHETVPFSDL